MSDSKSSEQIFTTSNYVDPRLQAKDSIVYPVKKGGNRITSYKQIASSVSSSQLTWNVIVPSSNTYLDPVVYIDTYVTFSCAVTAINAGAVFVKIGGDTCLNDFPLHRLMNIANLDINGNNTSWNVLQTLDLIKQLLDEKDLDQIDTVPTHQNKLLNLANAQTLASPWDVIDTSKGEYKQSKGKYSCEYVITPPIAAANGATNFTIQFHLVEPLLMSPFQLCNYGSKNYGGMHGLNNFGLDITLASANLISSIKSRAAGFSVSGVTFDPARTYLSMNFITPQASMYDIVKSRDVRPYMHIERNYVSVTGVADGVSAGPIYSPSINLGSMPSKIACAIRPSRSNAVSYTLSDFVITPDKFVVYLNGSDPQLSNSTKQQNYQMTRRNGSNREWNQHVGFVNLSNNATGTIVTANKIATTGSYIVASVGEDLSVDDSLASGSAGPFNFYSEVMWTNNTGINLTGVQLELVVFFLYEGMYVTEMGTSNTYNGSFLSRESVLSTSKQPVVNSEAHKNLETAMIHGAGWVESGMSGKGKTAGAKSKLNF